jgi:hypothetical protein
MPGPGLKPEFQLEKLERPSFSHGLSRAACGPGPAALRVSLSDPWARAPLPVPGRADSVGSEPVHCNVSSSLNGNLKPSKGTQGPPAAYIDANAVHLRTRPLPSYVQRCTICAKIEAWEQSVQSVPSFVIDL